MTLTPKPRTDVVQLKNGWRLVHRQSDYFDSPTILMILRAGTNA